ncbi:hypothetical protein BKA70DRAFT_1515480 [Coprinopsis sp. MPI-PUGE-AT-0042]|nr:hypothetical protein BKA70DRAFT_1515480 [Coprinopsis sp. MPI-PUGE-AT-0042]
MQSQRDRRLHHTFSLAALSSPFSSLEQIHADDHHGHIHARADAAKHYDYKEHSVLEDDSEGEDHDDYLDEDDDGSSSLSIPNESIDIDLVYAFHSFAATVDVGSLFLMDDSNSYCARILLIPTRKEMQQAGINASQDRMRAEATGMQPGRGKKGVHHEMSDEGDDEDEELTLEQMERRRAAEERGVWDDDVVVTQQMQSGLSSIPTALQPAQPYQQQLEQEEEEEEARQQQMQPCGSIESLGSRKDPLEATETRKITVTPNIARDEERPVGQPYLPSANLDEERAKRQREEESDEVSCKKRKPKEKMPPPVSSSSAVSGAGRKLRKEPSKEEDNSKDKKKSSFLGERETIQGDNSSVISGKSSENLAGNSENSSRSGGRGVSGAVSPTSSTALQQQQHSASMRLAEAAQAPSTLERNYQVSPHASSLRQRDQQQQLLYQQYLNRSPSSPPEAQPSYGLQPAPVIMAQSSSTSSGLGPPASRPRPGSLISTPAGMDGPGIPELVPEFNVVRGPEEQPLAVFETLVAETMELPKVKRSSVGSISSVSSNLSMHPAISKLAMNDFSDDSTVKFYLNRRSEEGPDETLIAEASFTESGEGMPTNRASHLTVSVGGANVTPERFTSPQGAAAFFFFPENVTVTEVIELGFERLGIPEGVVGGGDEVEDKYSKRRCNNRVRYGLVVDTRDGRERELSPSGRVIEAFYRPPTFRTPDRQQGKQRSLDAGHLLGSMEDVGPENPVYILRRATAYCPSGSRNRTSAPLDDLVLKHLQKRESTSLHSASVQLPSRQEIIAAQRAATRANQRAILSAQTNSIRGMDVLLPSNVVLRSSRYDVNDRMRYSEIIEEDMSTQLEEIFWRALLPNMTAWVIGSTVFSKQEKGKQPESTGIIASVESRRSLTRSISPSESVNPGSPGFNSKIPSGQAPQRPPIGPSRLGGATPTQATASMDRRQPSIASVMSDTTSGYATPMSVPNMQDFASKQSERKCFVLPKDDFGISHMMAIIDYRAAASQPKKPAPEVVDPVDKMLFGVPIDLESLHPQVREIYASASKHLDEIDKMLDSCIRPPVSAF